MDTSRQESESAVCTAVLAEIYNVTNVISNAAAGHEPYTDATTAIEKVVGQLAKQAPKANDQERALIETISADWAAARQNFMRNQDLITRAVAYEVPGKIEALRQECGG